MIRCFNLAAVLLLAGNGLINNGVGAQRGIDSFGSGDSLLAEGHSSNADSLGLPTELTKYLGSSGVTTVRGPNGAVGIPKAGATVPRTYVVEFADDAEHQIAAAHNSKAENKVKRSPSDINVHEEFHAFMARSIAEFHGDKTEKRGLIDSILRGNSGTDAKEKYQTRYSWNSPGLFRGVSVKLNSDSYAGMLSQAPGVSSVSPVGLITTGSVAGVPASDEVVKQYAARRKLGETTSKHSKRQNDIGQPMETQGQIMAGVDRLHAEGILGQGITIAVIDSGIGENDSVCLYRRAFVLTDGCFSTDYRHPALNGGKPAGVPCFGKPECKVIGGKNYVTDNSTYGPDDPLDDCEGHGSHTGAIAAGSASSSDQSWTGSVLIVIRKSQRANIDRHFFRLQSRA